MGALFETIMDNMEGAALIGSFRPFTSYFWICFTIIMATTTQALHFEIPFLFLGVVSWSYTVYYDSSQRVVNKSYTVLF